MVLGLSGISAEIVSNEPKGGKERTLTVVARGISKRSAKRAAMSEAKSVIPVRDQDINLIEKERSLGPVTSRYLFRITHNSDY